MNINILIFIIFVAFGVLRLTNPDKRKSLLRELMQTPRKFYQNCRIVINKLKK